MILSPKLILTRCYQYFMTTVGRKKVVLSANQSNAVVLLVPDYSNVGDLAIAYAQEKFLHSVGGFNVVSVPLSDTYRVLRSLRSQLTSNDVVFLVGGGSMGDLYPLAQRGREFVVKYLKKSVFISFPQSIIYSGLPSSKRSVKMEEEALSQSADRLVLFARESQSYDFMRSFFPGKVGYAPDIVLSLVSKFQSAPKIEREGVLLALRQDSERILSDSDHAMIQKVATSHGAVGLFDHNMPGLEIDKKNPYNLALEMFDRYRSVDLVMTDRLHGMIFAAVTGTPCVVLPNSNHKITGTYTDWISDRCPYVILLEDISQINLEKAIDSVLSVEVDDSFQKLNFDFSDLFDEIRRARERND